MVTPLSPSDLPAISDLRDWHFKIDFEKIAWAEFDRENETMNALGERPTRELAAIIAHVEEQARLGHVRGLIFTSAKSNNFIAGADIKEFDQLATPEQAEAAVRAVTELFTRMENLPVPVVAAIHGYCLGGGLEFALACHYRIADREDGTRLGFPEVRLGIIPGLHGTVRSLYKAGPIDAMQTMLTARMLRSTAAKAIGLVDQLVPTHHNLRWAARKAVLQKRKSKPLIWWKRLMFMGPIRRYLAEQMRKKTAAKVREDHYPAPFRLIDLFEEYADDKARLAREEPRVFAPLMASETSRNLRRVFLLSEKLKAQAPKDGPKFKRAHIIGAGTMGGDIAAWCVLSGMETSLQDPNAEAVARAKQRAKELFKKRLRKPLAVKAAESRLIADPEGAHVHRADVIIEAVFEDLDVKHEIFRAVEPKLKPQAILATNTSSLPIEEIARVLKAPERLIGLHFFNPVAKMPLVEVIKGPDTEEQQVKNGAAFVNFIKKYPIIVKSCKGFLVNRVLSPYLRASVTAVESGTPREKVDAAALQFGMPMGPIELADVVGLDIFAHVAKTLGQPIPEGSQFDRLLKANKLGKKTGEGFYKWQDGKPVKAAYAFDADELDALGRQLVKPMIDECERCLEEGIVANADLVDAGVIFGTGFAPFRGGPLHYRKTRQAALAKSGTPPSSAAAEKDKAA